MDHTRSDIQRTRDDRAIVEDDLAFHVFLERVPGPGKRLALPQSHPIGRKWELMEPEVIGIISHHLPTAAATLSITRRGLSSREIDDPVEVVVGAPASTQAEWDPLRQKILAVLAKNAIPNGTVSVIATGEYHSQACSQGTRIPVKHFDYAVKMGASYGVKGRDESATIGGQITLQDSKNRSFRLFMTAFHPFRNTIKGTKFQSEGGRVPRGDKIAPIVMPSGPDTRHTFELKSKWCAEKISRFEEAQRNFESTGELRFQDLMAKEQSELSILQEECEKIEHYTSNQIAGSLWACGKFLNQSSNPTDMALDWALIEPKDGRLVLNLRPRNRPAKLYKVPQTRIIGDRGTTYNVWRVNKLSKSKELFCRPGDSGAWALDINGNWAGMIMGGDTENSKSDFGWMLPVDELVRDIERTTNTKVVDPMSEKEYLDKETWKSLDITFIKLSHEQRMERIVRESVLGQVLTRKAATKPWAQPDWNRKAKEAYARRRGWESGNEQ